MSNKNYDEFKRKLSYASQKILWWYQTVPNMTIKYYIFIDLFWLQLFQILSVVFET